MILEQYINMNIKNNDILTDNLTDVLSDPGFIFNKILSKLNYVPHPTFILWH